MRYTEAIVAVIKEDEFRGHSQYSVVMVDRALFDREYRHKAVDWLSINPEGLNNKRTGSLMRRLWRACITLEFRDSFFEGRKHTKEEVKQHYDKNYQLVHSVFEEV